LNRRSQSIRSMDIGVASAKRLGSFVFKLKNNKYQ
jgi:hypothetical protein